MAVILFSYWHVLWYELHYVLAGYYQVLMVYVAAYLMVLVEAYMLEVVVSHLIVLVAAYPLEVVASYQRVSTYKVLEV